MKIFRNILLLSFPLLSTVNAVHNNYILSNDYSVTIHGTSNLHNWVETVGKVTGSAIVNLNDDGSSDLEQIQIKMDVRTIKSDNSTMNNKTYSALKADANPEITFTLEIPVKSIKISPGANSISASGELTIAGVTKPVTMQVKISMPEHGKLVFLGSQIIKMTDYGVSPPTALFGVLKTGDDITLDFKTNFAITN